MAREKDEAHVLKVEKILKGVFDARDTRQTKKNQVKEGLPKLQLVHSELQVMARCDRQMLHEVEQIDASKLYFL
ncbi:hypothetical protein D1007_45470 [Hordeum vulgare]|nr:hypothetical protein D1007_45470 [Hordeum vulgare]